MGNSLKLRVVGGGFVRDTLHIAPRTVQPSFTTTAWDPIEELVPSSGRNVDEGWSRITVGTARNLSHHYRQAARAPIGFYEAASPVPLGALRSLEILSMCAAKSGYPEMICLKASRSST